MELDATASAPCAPEFNLCPIRLDSLRPFHHDAFEPNKGETTT